MTAVAVLTGRTGLWYLWYLPSSLIWKCEEKDSKSLEKGRLKDYTMQASVFPFANLQTGFNLAISKPSQTSLNMAISKPSQTGLNLAVGRPSQTSLKLVMGKLSQTSLDLPLNKPPLTFDKLQFVNEQAITDKP